MHSVSRLRPRSAILALATVGALAGGAPSASAQTNVITTVAGTTSGFSGDTGPATAAQLNNPIDLAGMPGGGFLIAEQGNARVRRVLPDGTIVTVAGSGTTGFAGDTGPATSAQFNTINGVAVTTDGGFLVADSFNHRVRRVSPGGTITTAAGTGTGPFNADNIPATTANINFPVGLAVLGDGGYLIGDNDNERVRRVSPGGTITTAAGTGSIGSTGDGGPAILANLNGPAGVAVATDGAILIADANNRRIRRVATDGIITTVAGDGMPGSGGDGGPATAAQLNNPVDVAAMPDGGFVIADTNNHKIRRVSPGGTISTLAGTGAVGSGGDGGPATDAQFSTPLGLGVTAEGDVLVADTFNHRVRLIDSGATPPVPPGVIPEFVPPIAEIAQVPPGEPDRDADTIPDARDNCPDAPNLAQSDRDGDRIGDACDDSDASGGPTLASTVVARVVSGEVFVRLPGTRPRARPGGRAAQVPAGFVPLRGAAVLPVGTVADTRRGRVGITSVAGATRTGRRQSTQRSDFYEGIFQIRQRARPATGHRHPRAQHELPAALRRQLARRHRAKRPAALAARRLAAVGRRARALPHPGTPQLGHPAGDDLADRGALRRHADARAPRQRHRARQGRAPDRHRARRAQLPRPPRGAGPRAAGLSGSAGEHLQPG